MQRKNQDLIHASLYGHAEKVKALLESKADLAYLDEHGETALINAASNGHAKIVKMLLEQKADVNYIVKGEPTTTALLSAVYGGDHAEVAQILLESKADAGYINSWGNSALSEAERCGRTKVVQVIKEFPEQKITEHLRSSKASIENSSFKTTLAIAIHNNDRDEVEKLLKEKNILETKDFPVAFAYPTKITTEILELLEKYDALSKEVSIHTLKYVLYLYGNRNIDFKQLEGKTFNVTGCPNLAAPMELYSASGCVQGVESLMQCGVQERPLFELFQFGHLEFRHIELQHLPAFKKGIENNFAGKNNRVDPQLHNKFKIAELFLKNPTEKLDEAFDHKKEISSRDSLKLLPFFAWIAKNNRIDLLENKYFQRLITIYPESFRDSLEIAAVFKANAFIEKSIPMLMASDEIREQISFYMLTNIAIVDHNHELLASIMKKLDKSQELEDILSIHDLHSHNPLFWAIRSENMEAAADLLKHGVDPNGLDDEDNYLALAIRHKSMPMVQLLLTHGSKVNTKDNMGVTPLHTACQTKQWDIAKLLIHQYHANISNVDLNGKSPLDYITDESIKHDLLSQESARLTSFFNGLFANSEKVMGDKNIKLISEYVAELKR